MKKHTTENQITDTIKKSTVETISSFISNQIRGFPKTILSLVLGILGLAGYGIALAIKGALLVFFIANPLGAVLVSTAIIITASAIISYAAIKLYTRFFGERNKSINTLNYIKKEYIDTLEGEEKKAFKGIIPESKQYQSNIKIYEAQLKDMYSQQSKSLGISAETCIHNPKDGELQRLNSHAKNFLKNINERIISDPEFANTIPEVVQFLKAQGLYNNPDMTDVSSASLTHDLFPIEETNTEETNIEKIYIMLSHFDKDSVISDNEDTAHYTTKELLSLTQLSINNMKLQAIKDPQEMYATITEGYRGELFFTPKDIMHAQEMIEILSPNYDTEKHESKIDALCHLFINPNRMPTPDEVQKVFLLMNQASGNDLESLLPNSSNSFQFDKTNVLVEAFNKFNSDSITFAEALNLSITCRALLSNEPSIEPAHPEEFEIYSPILTDDSGLSPSPKPGTAAQYEDEDDEGESDSPHIH